MSMNTPAPSEPPVASPAGKERTSGCLFALLLVIGIALLLPGICSLIFIVTVLDEMGSAVVSVGWLWVLTFILAAGGIWLIRHASRNRR